ncbi:uncharacterized protein EI90DRAFT_3034666 [Cantharellus anzutake]|uniref:uncharacterized protein n=1 Tax=Cantharellus anzutake TaxID=1750568 RepID=UPI0019063E9B|nr:uncharacterized protein EI90DRAFT_3034666 [Cantharellus anzutake]KAF8341627.1 hypothetical protein EI90DRAFT_3034666 [Cantharellus anzutake]
MKGGCTTRRANIAVVALWLSLIVSTVLTPVITQSGSNLLLPTTHLPRSVNILSLVQLGPLELVVLPLQGHFPLRKGQLHIS